MLARVDTRADTWFPDWSGQACAIIASGPSTKQANVSALKGRLKVIAIKENVELAPFADIVYGCDAAWWKNQQGLPKFKGIKIAYDKGLTAHGWDIRLIDVRKIEDVILFQPRGTVGSGGNSGFQALNLAIQFGASRILLVGFDMHDRSGVHWYGRARGMGRSNPCEDNFRRWRRAFANAAPVISQSGVDVVNVSAASDLKCFRKLTVEQALSGWSL